jgi:DNA-binding XRE family transcriptional regulator
MSNLALWPDPSTEVTGADDRELDCRYGDDGPGHAHHARAGLTMTSDPNEVTARVVPASGDGQGGGRALRELRAERVLSIRELARLADVASGTIAMIEAGRTTPRLSIVRRLAAALGVDQTEVIEFRQAIEAAAAPRPAPGDRPGQPT